MADSEDPWCIVDMAARPNVVPTLIWNPVIKVK